MYFGLSEEQKSLEENISKFLSDNAPLDAIKAVADGEEVKADEIHKGIIELGQKFKYADGLIFCAPEYNGGSPPILTNAITWLSVITDNFRELFSNKKALIGTYSGGAGARFLSTFRIQLEHLGVIVFPRTIMVNNSKPFNEKSTKSILDDFIKLL